MVQLAFSANKKFYRRTTVGARWIVNKVALVFTKATHRNAALFKINHDVLNFFELCLSVLFSSFFFFIQYFHYPIWLEYILIGYITVTSIDIILLSFFYRSEYFTNIIV